MRTRVGYTGGTTRNPTYHSLGDHTESLQVDFDPAAVSYEDLLDIFWTEHSPTHRPWSTQYRAAVFYGDEEQQAAATASRDRIQEAIGKKVVTAVEPLDRFYLAEDYHQKYRLRGQRDMMAEFREMYPDEEGFVDSTAAARVNGYLDGAGDCDQLRRELPRLGLSEEAQRHLDELVCLRNPTTRYRCG